MKLFICLLFALSVLTGCTATCLRDTDCLGASVCRNDRCVWPGATDAGGRPAAPNTQSPAVPDPTASGDGGSAGASGAGGVATPPREILDAAPDGEPVP